MTDDPNPIGYPPRAFWAAADDLGVSFDELAASEYADGPESREVADGVPLASDVLPEWTGQPRPLPFHGPFPDITKTPRALRTPEQREYARLWAGMGADRQAMPPLPYGRSDYRWRKLHRAVYAAIGATPEVDEYVIEPEHKGGAIEGQRTNSPRVLSLDYVYDGGQDDDPWTLADDLAFEEDLAPLDVECDDFLDDLRRAVGLTRGEAAAVHWIVSGNGALGVDYLARMGDALGVSHNAAKMAWAKARRKLSEHWASEPPKLRTPGTGHRELSMPGAYPRDAYDNPEDYDRARRTFGFE